MAVTDSKLCIIPEKKGIISCDHFTETEARIGKQS